MPRPMLRFAGQSCGWHSLPRCFGWFPSHRRRRRPPPPATAMAGWHSRTSPRVRTSPCRTTLQLCVSTMRIACLPALVMSTAGRMPQAPAIETVEVPLAAWLASRDHALPDTLPDFAVDDARLSAFREFADALAAADWTKARQLAGPLDYQLVAIHEHNDWFVVASDDSGQGRGPTLVINASPRRDLVVEAPHVPFETGTAEQAAVLLRELGGRAAIVSGAHRCASRSFTTCDGRTGVCGSLEDYRDSDVGHNTGTLFHAAHLAFSEHWRNAIFISLHGMREDTDGVRTSLIISNGARSARPGGADGRDQASARS